MSTFHGLKLHNPVEALLWYRIKHDQADLPTFYFMYFLLSELSDAQVKYFFLRLDNDYLSFTY